jgi:nuclear pore complex protein Nup155
VLINVSLFNYQTPYLLSIYFSAEEIDWLIVQLLELKSFIEKNAQMPGNNVGQGKNDNAQQQDAYLRERQSLMFLQQLLNHSLQVLGLWKVVCEHGFELLSKSLGQDNQNVIKGR